MVSGLRAAVSVFAGAVVLAAQPPSHDPAVGGIVLGIVLDADTRLRPVFGVPGASTLGPPIAIDAGTQILAIAPDYVLGVRGDAHELVLITPSEQRAIATGVSRAVLSPRGSSAALLLDDGTLRVMTGLPQRARVDWTPDLSILPAPFSSMAVSDDGAALLAAALDGDRMPIFRITAASGPQVAAYAGKVAGLSFIPGSTHALVGDAENSQVLLLGPGLSPIRTYEGVVPVDVAASDTGEQFFIASANPSGVIAIDRASGAREAIPCDCDPTGLVRMGRTGLFRITESSAGLFWLLDSGSTTRRVVAVPPDASQASGGAQ